MMKVKLGDVAIERKETCHSAEGLPVVGLEHLIPGEVKLTQWSDAEDNTFTKAFHKGQVLFGRRRAYLKKAAVAPFDGICSGDITVIEAKQELLDPDLLPFIIQNDDLFDFAVGHSAGSLSPRVKWEHLKNYTFSLPSLDKQRDLACLLWAAVDARTGYQRLLRATDELVKSQFIADFGDPMENPMGWPTKGLLEFGDCKNGMNFHSGESGVEVHCLGVGNFQNYSVISDTSTLPIISLNKMPTEDVMLQDGDIVFVRSNGNKMLVGRSLVVYPGNIPTTYSGFCIRYRKGSSDVDTTYLLQLLKADSTRKRMAGRGANIQNLSQQVLGSLKIPVPPIDLQEHYASFVAQADKSKYYDLEEVKRCA